MNKRVHTILISRIEHESKASNILLGWNDVNSEGESFRMELQLCCSLA